MRLDELFRIDELVNAPDQEVYHWTNAASLYRMIHKGVIRGDTEHELNGINYQGVSFSRNPLFDIQDTYAIGGAKAWRIGINLRKLRADHKVFPIRYAPYRNIPRSKEIKAGSFMGNDLVGFRRTSSDESEEFCVGDVYPFWHYVSSLAVEMRHVAIDVHPNEMKNWDDDDLDGGDGTFGSCYSHADQGLMFDIMVGTFYGQGPYKEIWSRYGATTRKSVIRLPDNIPFTVIDRDKNRAIPFKEVAKEYLNSLRPPEEPSNSDIPPINKGKPNRNSRSQMFNQTSKSAPITIR